MEKVEFKMKIVAWGEKIGLRAFEDGVSDAEIERVYRWSRDQDLLQWSGGSPVELSLQEFSERIRHEALNPPSDRKMFFIVTRDGEMIGRIGCFGLENNGVEGELGIVIGERVYWNRGYGRDAIATLLRFIFETTPLERINLFTYTENVRAQKCFAACGFGVLGTTRRMSSDVDEFEGIEMQITRQEFFARANLTPPKIQIPQEQI